LIKPKASDIKPSRGMKERRFPVKVNHPDSPLHNPARSGTFFEVEDK